MKYLLLLITIVVASCNNNNKKQADASASSPIHFDGIYKSGTQTNQPTGDQSISYLRFYDDGTVINVSSTGTADQIKKWFVKGHENVRESHYIIEGKNIRFTSSGNNVDVKYDGKIITTALLQMHVTSSSNNHESDVTYSFIGE